MNTKNTASLKHAFHIYIVFFLLLIVLIAAGFAFFAYLVIIDKPDGTWATSAWPKEFTEDFSREISLTDGMPQLKQSGLELLEQYGLWFQLLNEEGDEVLAYNKPEPIPSSYTTTDLIAMLEARSTTENSTLFIEAFKVQDMRWSYIIGFPVHVDRVTMYLNGERFTNGKTIGSAIIGGMFFFIVFAGLAYGLWVTRQLSKMIKSVREIAARAYIPIKETGAFRDVYESLNQLDTEIRVSDETRASTDRVREEWIANITHDLKTPLSPIRGYAELIADAADSSEAMRRYGRIILKNTTYAEGLIDDLKLTYQLQNNMTPFHQQKQNMVRFLREIVIDLLNMPDYEDRSICFNSNKEDIPATLDPSLLRRAVSNLIINALVHNPEDTEISVSLWENDGIQIIISDNGAGMNAQETESLFTRYYRGTAAGEKLEGTGLGMAIAKEIVELHDGKIYVESTPDIGTKVIISFPASN